MIEKINAVINDLNVLLIDESVARTPRALGKLNTVKRYMLSLLQEQEQKQQTNNE